MADIFKCKEEMSGKGHVDMTIKTNQTPADAEYCQMAPLPGARKTDVGVKSVERPRYGRDI